MKIIHLSDIKPNQPDDEVLQDSPLQIISNRDKYQKSVNEWFDEKWVHPLTDK